MNSVSMDTVQRWEIANRGMTKKLAYCAKSSYRDKAKVHAKKRSTKFFGQNLEIPTSSSPIPHLYTFATSSFGTAYSFSIQ